MIIFNNWTITASKDVITRQGDNMTGRLDVIGDLPSGWTWEMLVQLGDAVDVIQLDAMDGGAGATLDRDQLAAGNRQYTLQLRGTQGDVVRHSNKITVYIPRSILPDAHWPTIPSEFTQFEVKIMDAVRRAEEAAARAEAAARGGSA